MRSQKSIISRLFDLQDLRGMPDSGTCGKTNPIPKLRSSSFPAVCILIFLFFSTAAFSQKVAIIVPEFNSASDRILEHIESDFSMEFDVTDRSMGRMIFAEKRFERPFNLSVEDSKNYGASVGCNYFLLVKTETLRRTSFEREKYFESYIAYFLVSSRTGKLLSWSLSKFEEDSPEIAEQKLISSIESSVKELSEKIHSSEIEGSTFRSEADDFATTSDLEGSKDLRPPMPYLRVKPDYTKTAGIYDVLATVDAAVDIDEAGNIKNIEILRWAGFGLDESVIDTIRGLKWRPADVKGRPLAMRVLLRYNFKNIDSKSEIDSK